jgi:zinc transport system substrate-binding protein
MERTLRRRSPGTMSLLVAALASLVFGSISAGAAEMKVVVSSKPAHTLVALVMGNTGTPGVIVGGTASPHSYAMKPSDAQSVNEAAVFFRISEGLEPFTSKLLKALPKSVRVVSLQEAPGLQLLDRREGGAFEAHGHGAHKEHGKGKGGKPGAKEETEDETDPHFWLSPRNAIAMVDYIASVMSEADAANAAAYKSNAAAAITALRALDAELERELKPYAGKPFVVLHDAYQYFEQRYGLTAVASIAVNPETAPSGKRLSAVRKKLADSGASCVMAEPGMQPKVVAAVIEGSKAKSVVLDPEATQLKPGPELYEGLMRGLVAGVKACFEAKS